VPGLQDFRGGRRTTPYGQQRGQQGNTWGVARAHRLPGGLSPWRTVCRGVPPRRAQRKESAATFAKARAIKLARDAEASEQRRGPTLHDYALRWVARHAGSGHDSVREQTREEYRRLLATFALSYFPYLDCRLGGERALEAAETIRAERRW